MSSWIVEDKTINKLIDFFISCSYSKEEYKPDVTRQLNKLGYDLTYDKDDNIQDANNLGLDMKKLNLMATNSRYNETGEVVDYEFKRVYEKDIYQIIKSLQCFLYQCSEGETPEEPLFKTLTNIERMLIKNIFMNLPAYKIAKWE